MELDHLPPPHHVFVQVVHPAAAGVQGSNQAPLLVIRPCPLRLGPRRWRLLPPHLGRIAPAVVPHLIQKDQRYLLWARRCFLQRRQQSRFCGQVVRIGTELAHLGTAQAEIAALQEAPDATQVIIAQPGKGGAHGLEGPAGGWWAVGCGRDGLASLVAGSLAQALLDFLSAVKAPSGGRRPVETKSRSVGRASRTT